MKTVTVVITDLDNTLFDWVRIWYEPFKAMLEEIIRISGIKEDVLLRDIKHIFQQHGTSEYAFVIQEIDSLRKKYPNTDLVQKFDAAIHTFRSARKKVLELYTEVEETLLSLKDHGVLIIGYTESLAFYTHFRLKTLGLDRILDFIYSPSDHDLPEGLTPEQVRAFSPEHYKLRRTIHRNTPDGKLKPNPGVLLQIIKDIGAIPDEVFYIGDNLMKDILMAQDAGVTDVWAKYGYALTRPEYKLLRQVTHWSAQTVEKEKEIHENPPNPSYTLEKSFGELMNLFDFQPFVDKSIDRVKLVLEAWKVTVDVQKHFNDLEMRIRNFALTLITAAIAAAGLIFKEDIRVQFYWLDIPLVSAILFGAIPIWISFYLMDRFWYHNFLIGAVKHGHFIERRLKSVLPELGLAHAISNESPTRVCKIKIRSSRKIDLFYLLGFVVLMVASFIALFAMKVPNSNIKDSRTHASIKLDEKSKQSTSNITAINDMDPANKKNNVGVGIMPEDDSQLQKGHEEKAPPDTNSKMQTQPQQISNQ